MADSLQLFLRLRVVPFSVFLAAFAVGTARVNSISFTVRFADTVKPGNGPVTLPSLPRSGNISKPLVVNLVSGMVLLVDTQSQGFWLRPCEGKRSVTGLRLSKL